MDTEIQVKIYLDNLVTKGKGPLKTGFAGKNISGAEPEASVSGNFKHTSIQSPENRGTVDDSFTNPAEITEDVDNANVENTANNSVEQTDHHNVQSTHSVDISQEPQSHPNNSIVTENGRSGDNDNSAACGFKMEKPKMTKFTGDVRDTIFRADFKHAIESRYSKRDSITFLHACLQGQPLDLIKRIGSDYDAAWDYLDSIYGDRRFIPDTVTQDIVKFCPLQHGEDARFRVPYDMDNSHMLSIIEQKMCADDRKVWSRDLERERKSASLKGLMEWMSVEMKSRMRATAPLRSSSNSPRKVNHLQAQGGEDTKQTNHRCWLCRNSTHWPDQCPKFAALSIDDRLKKAKENHVCFSCLKRAGRDHRVANCTRRQQCTIEENGAQCNQFHHILLHKSKAIKITIAATTETSSALLPIITANIHGQDGIQKRANVLFDTGAQVSLIRNDTALTLGLKGKDTSVTITKVGGDEEFMQTKVYRVPLESLDDGRRYSIKAIRMPSISEEVTAVQMPQITELLGLKNEKLRGGKGQVDLLIGIDHAHMHTGESKQAG